MEGWSARRMRLTASGLEAQCLGLGLGVIGFVGGCEHVSSSLSFLDVGRCRQSSPVKQEICPQRGEVFQILAAFWDSNFFQQAEDVMHLHAHMLTRKHAEQPRQGDDCP